MSDADPPARPDEGRERLLDDLRIVVVQGPYFQAHAAGRAIEALRADAERIRALQPYLKHAEYCTLIYPRMHTPITCNCGLVALLSPLLGASHGPVPSPH